MPGDGGGDAAGVPGGQRVLPVYASPSADILRSGPGPGGAVVRVHIRKLPGEAEVGRLTDALRARVYVPSAPGGFLLVYDLTDLRTSWGEYAACYQRAVALARFYDSPAMRGLRTRASEVVIATRSQALRSILGAVLALYPSPVKVSCREEFP